MATLAILVLSVPPLVTSFDPPLNFQPLITSLDGTPKELKEKMATISHALQGNAIFFIGASEVSTSDDEHYAVYNYFNNQLRRPVVAYGDAYIDNIAHFLLLSRFKNDLNANSKVVLQLAPDSFYGDGVPGAVFADNFPPSMFNPLMDDPEPRRFFGELFTESQHRRGQPFNLRSDAYLWLASANYLAGSELSVCNFLRNDKKRLAGKTGY
ncbi:hypothetical protein OS11_29440 [Dickeya oryzae]